MLYCWLIINVLTIIVAFSLDVWLSVVVRQFEVILSTFLLSSLLEEERGQKRKRELDEEEDDD